MTDEVLAIAMTVAETVEREAYGNDEDGGYFLLLKASEIIAEAIMADRRRCANIVDASELTP